MKIKVRREHSNKWEELKERNREAGKTHVRVGVFGTETHEGSADLTMVELAAIHEFGSPAANIPERSFIRATLNAKHDEIAKLLTGAAKAVVKGTVTVERALNIIGTAVVKDIKVRITSGPGIPPPLKDATIKHKGSSRPLVDTGQLKNAITHVVVTGEGSEKPGEAGGGEE